MIPCDSVFQLRQQHREKKTDSKKSYQPIIYWTIGERILSFLSPPRLDRKIKDPSDSLDYNYRINRKGVDYPTPETDTAYIVGKSTYKTRSPESVYESHLIACRFCAEAETEGELLCVVGRELLYRWESRSRKAIHNGEYGGIYIDGRGTK